MLSATVYTHAKLQHLFRTRNNHINNNNTFVNDVNPDLTPTLTLILTKLVS